MGAEATGVGGEGEGRQGSHRCQSAAHGECSGSEKGLYTGIRLSPPPLNPPTHLSFVNETARGRKPLVWPDRLLTASPGKSFCPKCVADTLSNR